MSTLLKLREQSKLAFNEKQQKQVDNHLATIKSFAVNIFEQDPNLSKLTIVRCNGKSEWEYDKELGCTIRLQVDCPNIVLYKAICADPFFDDCRVSLYENYIEITL